MSVWDAVRVVTDNVIASQTGQLRFDRLIALRLFH